MLNLNSSSHRYLVASLILLAAALLISFNFMTFAMDEYTYMNTARVLSHGNIEEAVETNPELSRFPLFPAVLSIFFAVFGSTETVAKLVNLLIALAGVAILFLVSRKLFGEEVGAISALILATNPLYIFFASRVLTEPLYIVLITVSAYFLYQAREQLRNLVYFGFTAALATLTRYSALYLGVAAVAWLAINGQILMALKSKWTYIAAVVFVLVLLPWLQASYILTGNYFGFLIEFTSRQLQQQGVGFGLPDKIPSNILAAPFVIGAPLVFLLFLVNSKAREAFAKNDAVKFLLLNIIVIAVGLEVIGLFRPSLLRYIAVIIPFSAMLVSFIAVNVKADKLFGLTVKQLLLFAVIVNLAIGLGLIAFFGNYEKQVAYRQAGLFVRDNCKINYSTFEPVVYTNFEQPITFYTEFFSAREIEPNVQCIAYSFYDGLTPTVPVGYSEVYRYGKIAVYKK